MIEIESALIDEEASKLAEFSGRKSPARASHPTEETFKIETMLCLDWDEFRSMSREEFRDKYLREIVRLDILSRVRLVEARLGRPLEFRKFRLPEATGRRKVFTIDRDGIFIGAVAIRQTFPAGKAKPRDTITVRLRVEIAIEPHEGDLLLGVA